MFVEGDLPLTSVIGAGGRPWLRFLCIRNYPKVFYPLQRLATLVDHPPRLYTPAIFRGLTNRVIMISSREYQK